MTPETKARISAIKRKWVPGASASDLAAAIGNVSRNAICGIYSRHRDLLADYPLQSPRRTNPGSWKTGKNAGPRANMFGRELKDKHRTAPVVSQADEYDATALNVTLMDLKRGQCKWPVNDGGPFLFCGHPAETGQPYCTHHANRSVSMGTAAERSAVRTARSLARKETA